MSGLEESDSISVSEGSGLVSSGVDTLMNSFGFVDNVKNNVNSMIDIITNTESSPRFQLNMNCKWFQGTVTILDLSWYTPFKEYGDTVICIFAYLSFLWNIFIRLPDIIQGAGASSYAGNMIGDIEAYRKTGFGRSSSPRL